MKLFIAGQGIPRKDIFKFREEQRNNGREIAFLHSYLEIKNGNYELLTRSLSPENIILDSGAFTAFTLGKVIDIDHYIKVIKEVDIPYYIVLDVIGDYKATANNLAYMESKGVSPIPTFHTGSPIVELEKLLDKYEYIALGGLVPLATNRKKLQEWLDYCFATILKHKPLRKIHLLGINSLWAWKRYPIYSADATSWVSGSKFRRIIEYDANKMKMNTHHKGVDSKFSYKVWEGNYIDLNIHNIIEYQKAAEHITKLWESRGVKWN